MDSQRRGEPARGPLIGEGGQVGPYDLESLLGEGGMGAVYLGRARSGEHRGKPVAVKVVRSQLAGDPAFRARFRDEAANAARVASFCTAHVLDYGEAGGHAYMVTEYIDGPSLLQHVGEKGALSLGMLDGVAVGVAAALVAIHAAGLVHRDLKPSNVLLSMTGPRVIDFGIARALDVTSSLTQTGQVIGSPGWIAPEQILNQEVTPAVDLFSWGCLVAYAGTGRHPFGTGSFQLLAARVVHAEPELSGLKEPLAGLVRRALDRDPRRRPTAQDLLLRLVGGSGEAAVTHTLGASWQGPLPAGERLAPPAGPPSGHLAPPEPERAAPPVTEAGSAPWSSRPLPHDGPSPAETVRFGPAGPADSAGPAGPATGHGQPVPAAPLSPSSGTPGETARDEPAAAYAGSATGTAHDPLIGTVSGGGGYFAPPSPVAPTEPVRPGRARPGRNRRLVLAGGAATLTVALVVGGVLLFKPDSEGSGGGGPSSLPSEPLLVRKDTAPGWPKECHAQIALLEPGPYEAKPLLDGAGCDVLPQRSPDGETIAFTRWDGNSPTSQVMVMDSSGGQLRQIGDGIVPRSRVAWSPDGTRLAGMSVVNGTPQLFVQTLAGGVQRQQLTHDRAAKDDPTWSKDGKLAFWSERDGSRQIYYLDPADPQRWTPVTDRRIAPNGVNDPHWSPDGTRMAFTWSGAPGTGSDIAVVGADGRGFRRLTAAADHDMDPQWSPKGDWLAFVRGPLAMPRIFAMRADGTGVRTLGPAGLGHPNWTGPVPLS